MARKVRRVRRQPANGKQQAANDANAAGSRRRGRDDLSEEYAYVLKDLRRVLLLAAVMFLLLIILNLVI